MIVAYVILLVAFVILLFVHIKTARDLKCALKLLDIHEESMADDWQDIIELKRIFDSHGGYSEDEVFFINWFNGHMERRVEYLSDCLGWKFNNDTSETNHLASSSCHEAALDPDADAQA